MRISRTAFAILLCATLCALAASPAAAAPILPTWSTWEYTFTDPTGNVTWNTTTGTAGWLTGQAPFGNSSANSYDPLGYFNYETFWAADGTDGDDLWVRQAINLAGFDLASIRWNLGVDNGFALFANGVLVSAANAEGYTSRWEYTGGFAPGVLNPGVNVIAVALEDHGGLTAFDMEVIGNPAPVPEPASMLMLGTGLVGLRAWRKRRQ